MAAHAVISLGSNKKSPEINLLSAVRALEHLPHLQPIGLSSGYWTKPLGPPQATFLNAAIAVETSYGPRELLAALLGIEVALGRRRNVPWGPRIIDLDLLWMDDMVLSSSRLQLPHPRLAQRAFALVPLVEIAPEIRDPLSGEKYSTLLKNIDSTGVGDPFPLPCKILRQDLDHTADFGMITKGKTLSDLFENTALALIDIIANRSRVTERKRKIVEFQSTDRIELIVGILSEIVFLVDAHQFIPKRACLLRLDEKNVRLALYGENLQEKNQLSTRVKAVTFHNAAIERDDSNQWQATIVVDV